MRAATAMLANAAEVRGEMLDVLGGGTERRWVGDLPTEVAPTVVVSVEPDGGDGVELAALRFPVRLTT